MSFTSEASTSARPTSTGTSGESRTTVDANTTIDGMLSTSHDLRVEGRVTGTLMCDGLLEIAQGAEVDATVEASSIVVSGSLSGAITCHGRLEIRSTGIVRGRVDTGRLIVVEGAVYEGQLRMDGLPETVDNRPIPSPEDDESAPPPQATGSYSFLRSFAPGAPPAPPADDVLPGSSDDDEPE